MGVGGAWKFNLLDFDTMNYLQSFLRKENVWGFVLFKDLES
jgi:hypothetical protein